MRPSSTLPTQWSMLRIPTPSLGAPFVAARSVDEFARAGGTHFLLVHKPDFDALSPSLDAYRAEFERTSAYEKTARAVIALRAVRGLTQEQLAEMIGTTASAISRLESGEHSPNLETLRKIANACGGHLRLRFDVPGRRSPELVATL